MRDFTRLVSQIFGVFVGLLVAQVSLAQPSGECELACQDQVTISLNSTCERQVLPADVLSNNDPDCSLLTLQIEYPYPDFNVYPSKDYVDAGLVGYSMIYRVIDPNNQNVCWGYLRVEDKFPPGIFCENDTISCLRSEVASNSVATKDNCSIYFPGPQVDIQTRWESYDCDQDSLLIGYIARKITSTDLWGNSNTCADTLFILKETLDSLICGPDTLLECTTLVYRNNKFVELLWNTGKNGDTYLDDQGYAHPWPTDDRGYFPAPYLKSTDPNQPDAFLIPEKSDSGPIFNNSGKCMIVYEYTDYVLPTCGKSYKIRRVWEIFDWCTKRDTQCIQWLKFQDTEGPVFSSKYLHSSDGNSEEQACDYLPESVYKKAEGLKAWLVCKVLTADATPHDCKSGITLPDPRPYIEKDCDDEFEVLYEIVYDDPGHPGKTTIESGSIPEGGSAHVYLPYGWHCVVYTIRDGCWNETKLVQGANIYDNTPPDPVCDEITQVTLDPDQCWARVYAKDLDDGSHDNCCDQLHFAVASMDSIDYWRNYWHEYFAGCLDPYDYHHYSNDIDEAIEEWINIFVFDDYIDVTECGSEQLVVRVYEACDLPVYDPHIFYGGEHEWYWWNLSEKFAAWYLYQLNEYIHYGDPRPVFSCSITDIVTPLDPAEAPSMEIMLETGKSTSGIIAFHNPIQWEPEFYSAPCFSPEEQEHGSFAAPICFYFGSPQVLNEWKSRVYVNYPEEVAITSSMSTTKRWVFPHLYNDCMIEVRKDDKQPPVVVAPDDITVYCDGVPYWWELTKTYAGGTKSATVKGHGAQFTHDVCWNEDYLTSYCSDPFVASGASGLPATSNDNINSACCVEVPWNSVYGYYHGSACGDNYSYAGKPTCDDYSDWYDTHSWQPIYCRLWLMLDKYDADVQGGQDDGAHPDPHRYFDETAEDWIITDNCWTPEYEEVIEGSLNECGVGTLTKTITAVDKCGNTSYDHQTLYVLPRSDFEVIFPEDLVVTCDEETDLDATAEGAGYPIISDDDCELIGVTYSDERFETTDGCYKILRTWKLIDWCVFSPDIHSRYPDVIVDDRLVASADRCCVHRNLKDDGDGYMTYLQVIKVIDEIAPEISCNTLEPTCIFDNNCDAATAQYELLASGSDNCTPENEIRYRHIVTMADVPVYYGTGSYLDEELPVGDYGVWLIGEDGCGNADSCYTTFSILDCKKPTPYCYNGIATVVMPTTKSITICAKDLDAGSYDNCTEQGKLKFSFTENPEDSCKTFVCDDVLFNLNELIEIMIWVTDEAGNQDFCTTYIRLQNGSDEACKDISQAAYSVSGTILTESGQLVQNVKVSIEAPGFAFTSNTNNTGTYVFTNIPGHENYRIRPYKNDDPVNGLSTLDIVKIQKHILGVEKLTSPYQMLAADINKSNSITAVDIIELRKIILGYSDQMPNNTSWRFVASDYTFADIYTPWDASEMRPMQDISEDKSGMNFIAVKVGDVNGSATASGLQSVEVRSNETWNLTTNHFELTPHTRVDVPVYAYDFSQEITGAQFTVSGHDVKFLGVRSGSIQVDQSMFAVLEPGLMTVTLDQKGKSLPIGSEPLFYIQVESNTKGGAEEAIQLGSLVTAAEACRPNLTDVLRVGWESSTLDHSVDGWFMYQNYPNPFSSQTMIGIIAPKDGKADLEIFDIQGKQLLVRHVDCKKGYNEVMLAADAIGNHTGLLYVKLKAADLTLQQKMLKIQ